MRKQGLSVFLKDILTENTIYSLSQDHFVVYLRTSEQKLRSV